MLKRLLSTWASEVKSLEHLFQQARQSNGKAQYELAMMYFDAQKEQDNDIHFVELDTERQKLNRRNESSKDMKTIKQKARERFKTYMAKEKRRKELERTSNSNSMVMSTAAQDLNFMDVILNPTQHINPVKEMYIDETIAAKWLRHAAQNDYDAANVQLGNLSVQHDPPLPRFALHWYLRVPTHPDALYNLGLMYYEVRK